jgi:pilus assembly protein Flp/PilA
MLSYFVFVTSVVTDRLRRDDRGASLVEYGLLVALIAVVCFVAIQLLGTQLSTMFNTIAGEV